MLEYFIVLCGLLFALVVVRAALGNASGLSRLEFGISQTPGNRQINADVVEWAYYRDELFFAVADGIGQGEKALTAAKTATHIVSRVFEQTGVGGNPAYFFRNSFRGANSAVLRYIPDSTAGASLLGAAVKGNLLYYALAGNCKISIFRKGELYELSEGHTFDVLVRQAFQRQKITRVDALEAIKESRLYNFVGKDGFRDLEMFDRPIALKRRDIILIMTDGVYEFCPDGELSRLLGSRGSCQAIARRITDTLDHNNHPDQDNASVIVARVKAA